MTTQPASAPAETRTGAYLEVHDLRVTFGTDDGVVRAVDGLSFTLERGRTLGIVGESGSGKSAASLAMMGLQRGRRTKVGGEIWLNGENLVTASDEHVRSLRGREMAMIFQDPLSAMHPYFRIGAQIIEAYRVHHDVSKKAAKKRAIELLDRVGIPDPHRRVDNYPHEFSGGMRQRAMIAMALSCDPSLLIADEPTTALDVTVQAQILDLLRDLQKEFGSAIIIITHDLGVVAEISDEVLVMYAGNAVEHGPVQEIFSAPQHPYTWGLLSSITRLDRARADRLRAVPGNPPSLIAPPPGCPFHPRCQYADLAGIAARNERPTLELVAPGHRVACHLPAETRVRLFREEVAPKL
ncbi:ABC transporter ATP-binding protein [Frankia sp. CNm7]|uniref:ABC transporter ATP-binding protein n=1 Tax=Frankia nepalensis TaxID=1836974 RepID=A0A937UVD4_9ACTN|nr:ABC transporter ATP-binding protein [Frankia nepalensis]MBL7499951.1 ABC transporter ATP-binding protein [Frankia nepalensis]MBL7515063.1 ABC transporter ATP-binding protein [Frankia nepalensis]MBL7524729.1 ABC transporter ATP-binding protein [Frankia nepalensis]MBL7632131.1 ABC transporter ATP-binding protein [Frankia nepalensis]